jgi:hypothetical protein
MGILVSGQLANGYDRWPTNNWMSHIAYLSYFLQTMLNTCSELACRTRRDSRYVSRNAAMSLSDDASASERMTASWASLIQRNDTVTHQLVIMAGLDKGGSSRVLKHYSLQ